MAKLSSHVTPQGPTIVVVDDDPSILKSLARLLRSVGYTVESFASPQDCLSSWEASLPGCYVIDVQMPGMSGFELLAQLRQQGCQSPAIFITAHDSSLSRASAHQHGSTGLLLKPFEDTALLAAVAQAMQNPPPL